MDLGLSAIRDVFSGSRGVHGSGASKGSQHGGRFLFAHAPLAIALKVDAVEVAVAALDRGVHVRKIGHVEVAAERAKGGIDLPPAAPRAGVVLALERLPTIAVANHQHDTLAGDDGANDGGRARDDLVGGEVGIAADEAVTGRRSAWNGRL